MDMDNSLLDLTQDTNNQDIFPTTQMAGDGQWQSVTNKRDLKRKRIDTGSVRVGINPGFYSISHPVVLNMTLFKH